RRPRRLQARTEGPPSAPARSLSLRRPAAACPQGLPPRPSSRVLPNPPPAPARSACPPAQPGGCGPSPSRSSPCRTRSAALRRTARRSRAGCCLPPRPCRPAPASSGVCCTSRCRPYRLPRSSVRSGRRRRNAWRCAPRPPPARAAAPRRPPLAPTPRLPGGPARGQRRTPGQLRCRARAWVFPTARSCPRVCAAGRSAHAGVRARSGPRARLRSAQQRPSPQSRLRRRRARRDRGRTPLRLLVRSGPTLSWPPPPPLSGSTRSCRPAIEDGRAAGKNPAAGEFRPAEYPPRRFATGRLAGRLVLLAQARREALPITYDVVRKAARDLYGWSLKKVPDDTLQALRQARERETSPVSQRTLDFMQAAALAAEREDRHACSDAGFPTYFVRIGTRLALDGDIRRAF